MLRTTTNVSKTTQGPMKSTSKLVESTYVDTSEHQNRVTPGMPETQNMSETSSKVPISPCGRLLTTLPARISSGSPVSPVDGRISLVPNKEKSISSFNFDSVDLRWFSSLELQDSILAEWTDSRNTEIFLYALAVLLL